MKRGLVHVMLVLAGISCSSESADPGPSGTDNPSTNTDPAAPTPSGESSSGSPAPQAPGTTPGTPPGDGQVHAPLFVGRFDTTDPKGPRATWPGARILARFEGTAVSVKLSEFAE